MSGRRTVSLAVTLPVSLLIAGCGATLESSHDDGLSSPSPSSSTGDGVAVTDLSVIGCAWDDPADEGELTGAWAGNDSGVYYIRQVGDRGELTLADQRGVRQPFGGTVLTRIQPDATSSATPSATPTP